jgi:hypothetical protein
MTKRHTYDIVTRPVGDAYESLLRVASRFATFLGVIVRSERVRLTDRARAVLVSLEPHLVRVEDTASWPGTDLIGGRVSKRYIYRLTPESLDVLVAAASDLYQWVNPSLPEDLHLLREDGSTVLGSVAQEEDAWLELDDTELIWFREHAPGVLEATSRDGSG